MKRDWAPAIKASLGDTWHLTGYGGGYSACDYRMRLQNCSRRNAQTCDGPSDVRVCGRCQALARHWNAADLERV